MSKMSEKAMTTEELRNAAAITNFANYLEQQFSGDDTEEQPEKALVQKSALTFEQARAILADESRQSFIAEIETLLQKYGTPKLSGITSTHHIG